MLHGGAKWAHRWRKECPGRFDEGSKRVPGRRGRGAMMASRGRRARHDAGASTAPEVSRGSAGVERRWHERGVVRRRRESERCFTAGPVTSGNSAAAAPAGCGFGAAPEPAQRTAGIEEVPSRVSSRAMVERRRMHLRSKQRATAARGRRREGATQGSAKSRWMRRVGAAAARVHAPQRCLVGASLGAPSARGRCFRDSTRAPERRSRRAMMASQRRRGRHHTGASTAPQVRHRGATSEPVRRGHERGGRGSVRSNSALFEPDIGEAESVQGEGQDKGTGS